MGADIRALLKERREELELTQETLAEQLAISPRYYQQLESGWASPSLDLALSMAEVFGKLEIDRNGQRFVIQALRPTNDAVHLNRIDRSACAVLMKLAEEESEGAAAVSRDLMAYINRLRDVGEDVEALASMYEQCIADVRTAIEIAQGWFEQHRPDVVERGEERHRQKLWERGYIQGCTSTMRREVA